MVGLQAVVWPKIAQSGEIFEALLPYIPRGEGQRISRYMYMLMMGMTQMPSGDQSGSQAGMPISWLDDFRVAFSTLLLGMERRSP